MNGDPSRMPRFHDGMQFYAQRGPFEHNGDHHWLALLLFIALAVALLVIAASIVRLAFAKGASVPMAADDALSVLRLRYARGEVGREEFLLAHGDLGGRAPPAEAQPAT